MEGRSIRSSDAFKMICFRKHNYLHCEISFVQNNRMGAGSQGCISVNLNVIYCSQHIPGVHRWPEETG